MDSLTQIVLGAACGELTMGKKIGNKAMLWGAFGGTIPDLDVIIGQLIFNQEIDKLAFHRGIMHSFLFAFIAPIVLGIIWHFVTTRMTKNKNHTTQADWTKLFFWSIFTHPILDSFTGYGTQLFRPFSDYRVAFNNISVADPLYTIPFLVCIIVAMFFKKTNSKRLKWTWLGIGLSSFYLSLTIGNKLHIDHHYKKSLDKQEIPFTRYMSQPTIFNNILWYGIAETDSNYYTGLYSLFDSGKEIQFNKIPKNHELLLKYRESKTLETLDWFSNGYYNVFFNEDGTYRYNDLRYPNMDVNHPEHSVFFFDMYDKNGELKLKPFKPPNPKKKELQDFWNRIWGKY